MLSIRNAEPADYDAINAFLDKEALDHFDPSLKETMLLVDEDYILGFATAVLVDLRPTLDAIFIPQKLRGHLLGDAVLRGLLYYFMNRGFEKVYALDTPVMSEFLRHVGFTEGEFALEVVLEDFFDKKCRGCRDANA